jgi:hypothetical protein
MVIFGDLKPFIEQPSVLEARHGFDIDYRCLKAEARNEFVRQTYFDCSSVAESTRVTDTIPSDYNWLVNRRINYTACERRASVVGNHMRQYADVFVRSCNKRTGACFNPARRAALRMEKEGCYIRERATISE